MTAYSDIHYFRCNRKEAFLINDLHFFFVLFIGFLTRTALGYKHFCMCLVFLIRLSLSN